MFSTDSSLSFSGSSGSFEVVTLFLEDDSCSLLGFVADWEPVVWFDKEDKVPTIDTFPAGEALTDITVLGEFVIFLLVESDIFVSGCLLLFSDVLSSAADLVGLSDKGSVNESSTEDGAELFDFKVSKVLLLFKVP